MISGILSSVIKICGKARELRLPVNFPPVSDLQTQNDQQSVLNLTENSVVTHAITPELAQRPFQRFSPDCVGLFLPQCVHP